MPRREGLPHPEAPLSGILNFVGLKHLVVEIETYLNYPESQDDMYEYLEEYYNALTTYLELHKTWFTAGKAPTVEVIPKPWVKELHGRIEQLDHDVEPM